VQKRKLLCKFILGGGNFRFSEFEFSQREAFGSDFLVIVLKDAGGLQGKLQ